MTAYNVHAGHAPDGSGGAHGAVGLLKESTEARKVKERLIQVLRSQGHTVYDCTCNEALTQYEVLSAIVRKCNSNTVALDISIHLNSGRSDNVGDGSNGGCEVWCYNSGTSAVAGKICENISHIGYRNRGVKYSQSLYVLKNTKAPAILVECAFVDDKDDAQLWDAARVGEAIAAGILGIQISPGKDESGSPAQPISPDSRPGAPESGSEMADISYQVFAGKWYPNVRNLTDYAGVKGKAISGIYANSVGSVAQAGNLQVRVHLLGGKWLPWVTDRSDYAGILGKPIDAVQIRLVNLNGRAVRYRVSPVDQDYYPFQTETDTTDGQDGYAGAYGVRIDRLQMEMIAR
ncbi:MAG: N-acetylmuramoyl-L-alanine amidase [Hespellia sp.]|nr:N-acetylmuramoyl-L-alanine amidase [Hespellia sp.]